MFFVLPKINAFYNLSPNNGSLLIFKVGFFGFCFISSGSCLLKLSNIYVEKVLLIIQMLEIICRK